MDLTQFERMKSELKRKRYDRSKVQGPSCRDWKLPGTLLRNPKGIYIFMYINSRADLQEVQDGFRSEWGILLGGFKEVCQDAKIDLEISECHKGLNAKPPSLLLPPVRADGRSWPSRSSALGALRGSAKVRRRRGNRGNRVGRLTSGGGGGERPEQAGGGRPEWPARLARGGGAPALPGRRGEVGDAHLDALELLVVPARLEGRRKCQIGGGGGSACGCPGGGAREGGGSRGRGWGAQGPGTRLNRAG
jgi:hypothetical protein